MTTTTTQLTGPLAVECRLCSASPGEPCRTTPRRAPGLEYHLPRYAPIETEDEMRWRPSSWEVS